MCGTPLFSDPSVSDQRRNSAHQRDDRPNLVGVLYRMLADATAGVHFLFVAYLVVGGFLAWRWRWTIWTHIAAVAWGFSTVVFGFGCPLTYLENSMRVRGGDGALPSSGFIDHYITGVLYPRSALDVVRVLVIVIVAVSWVGFVQLRRRQRPGTAIPGPSPAPRGPHPRL